MRIRIVDPKLRTELTFHFERAGFAVERLDDLVEISRPDAPSDVQSRLEIDVHLAVWRVMNPDALLEVLDG
jgi:hypothetical protein